MIPDITNQVFTEAKAATLTVAPTATVKSSTEESPAAFPFASIRVVSNTTYTPTSDSASLENHQLWMFECQNYSNKVGTKEADVRAMANAQRAYFLSIGFVCIFFQPVDSMNPSQIARHVGRYQGAIDQNKLVTQP